MQRNCFAGPSHSTSHLTGFLPAESNLSISLSAPPGDPTICPPTFSPATLTLLGLAIPQQNSTATSSIDSGVNEADIIVDEVGSCSTLNTPGLPSSKHNSTVTSNTDSGPEQQNSTNTAALFSTDSGAGDQSDSVGNTASSSTDSDADDQANSVGEVPADSTLATLQAASARSSSAHSLLTESLAAAKQQDEDRRAAHAQASPSGVGEPPSDGGLPLGVDSEAGLGNVTKHVTGSRTPPQHGSRSSTAQRMAKSGNLNFVTSPGALQNGLSMSDAAQANHMQQHVSSSVSPDARQTRAKLAGSDEERLQQVLTGAGGSAKAADTAPEPASFAERLIGSLLPAAG